MWGVEQSTLHLNLCRLIQSGKQKTGAGFQSLSEGDKQLDEEGFPTSGDIYVDNCRFVSFFYWSHFIT